MFNYFRFDWPITNENELSDASIRRMADTETTSRGLNEHAMFAERRQRQQSDHLFNDIKYWCDVRNFKSQIQLMLHLCSK